MVGYGVKKESRLQGSYKIVLTNFPLIRSNEPPHGKAECTTPRKKQSVAAYKRNGFRFHKKPFLSLHICADRVYCITQAVYDIQCSKGGNHLFFTVSSVILFLPVQASATAVLVVGFARYTFVEFFFLDLLKGGFFYIANAVKATVPSSSSSCSLNTSWKVVALGLQTTVSASCRRREWTRAR